MGERDPVGQEGRATEPNMSLPRVCEERARLPASFEARLMRANKTPGLEKQQAVCYHLVTPLLSPPSGNLEAIGRKTTVLLPHASEQVTSALWRL